MTQVINIFKGKKVMPDLNSVAEKLREELVYECDNYEVYRDNGMWSDDVALEAVRTHLNNVKEIASRLEQELNNSVG